jgi:hypothetical protein
MARPDDGGEPREIDDPWASPLEADEEALGKAVTSAHARDGGEQKGRSSW